MKEIIDMVTNNECEGDCDKHGGHSGECKLCQVTYGIKNWGYFSYCATAQEVDEERGFEVEPVECCE